jgi:putative Mg2+ transporter-C (MgtC) family protein
LSSVVGDTELVGRLALAAGLGFAIGLERRLGGHAAGERTFALVSLGCCLFTVAGLGVAGESSPTRIAAQVVTGIGFLGAGLIFNRQTGGPAGLTTAAGVWTVAAVGVGVGLGKYVVSVVAAAIALAVLLLGPLLDGALSRWSDRRAAETPN